MPDNSDNIEEKLEMLRQESLQDPQKPKNPIIYIAIAVCAVIVLAGISLAVVLTMQSGQTDDGGQSTLASYDEDIALLYEDITVYYLENGEEKSEIKHLPSTPQDIFNAWAELNNIDEKAGEKVELLSASVSDNGWEETTDSTAVYHTGTEFTLTLTVSDSMLKCDDSDALAETLKKTMSESGGITYNKVSLLFGGTVKQPNLK